MEKQIRETPADAGIIRKPPLKAGDGTESQGNQS
jgi:hypothetical protein